MREAKRPRPQRRTNSGPAAGLRPDQKRRVSPTGRRSSRSTSSSQSIAAGGAPRIPAQPFRPPPRRQAGRLDEERGRRRRGRYRGAPAAPDPQRPGSPHLKNAVTPRAPPPPPQNAWPDDAPLITPAVPSTIQVIKTQPGRRPRRSLSLPRLHRRPQKEESAEDILKKQKGHFDDSSGQFVSTNSPKRPEEKVAAGHKGRAGAAAAS